MVERLGTMSVKPGFPNDGGKEPWEIQEGMQTGSPGGWEGMEGKAKPCLQREDQPLPVG